MYQDLVVPLTGTPGDAAAIDAALDLARAAGARVTVLQMLDLPMPTGNPWGVMPDIALGDFYSRQRAQAEVDLERRRSQLAGSGVECEVRLVEALFSAPPRQAARVAHAADLVVLAGPADGGAGGSVAHDFAAALLLESGRPVLVVPPGARAPSPGSGVLVGWRQGAEAARAVHDALPLLRAASRVEVLAIDPPPGQDDALDLAELATHLARHGVRVEPVVRGSQGRAVADILVEHARAMPASLIVAGGYGHSRLREWVMGGATRELLLTSPLPVLFSH
ncbi:MAG TPA: universal stress protein [Luteimonas sp.]